jgi:hypothetical protein
LLLPSPPILSSLQVAAALFFEIAPSAWTSHIFSRGHNCPVSPHPTKAPTFVPTEDTTISFRLSPQTSPVRHWHINVLLMALNLLEISIQHFAHPTSR